MAEAARYPARPSRASRPVAEGKPNSTASCRWWVLACIFCMALAVRLIYLAEDSSSPFFWYRGLDADDYHKMALGLDNETWPAAQAFFRAPLYPLFLGVLYKILGQGAAALKIAQAVLGSASCVLVYLIARRVFQDRFVPIAAAVICCLSGTMIYFDGQLLSANLDLFLQLGVVWLLLAAAGRSRIGWWVLAGVCIGLSAINRGPVLLLLPIIVFWTYAVTRRGQRWTGQESNGPNPSFWRPAVALMLPVAIVIFPVAWHNAKYDLPTTLSGTATEGEQRFSNTLKRLASGQFVLIAYNAGINFYLGNHWELRHINNTDHPEHFLCYQRIQDEPVKKGIQSASKQNRYFTKETMRHIREAPADFIKLMGIKLFQLFDGAEIPRNANLYADRQYSVVLSALLWDRGIAFPSGLLIPFGLVGIFLARHSWRRHLLLLGCLAVQSVFILAFFVTARYRLLCIPLLSIYAAFAVAILLRHLRQGEYGKLAFPVVLLAGLGLLCNANPGPVGSGHGAYEHYNLANVLAEEGDLEQAIKHYSEALRIKPSYFTAQNNLANTLLRLGRAEQAIVHYSEALRIKADYADAHYNLGNVMGTRGRNREAAEHFRQVLRFDPDHTGALNNLAWLLATWPDGSFRNAAEAVRLARRLCQVTDNNDPGALDTLAAAYAESGQFDQAVATAIRALRLARSSSLTSLAMKIQARLQLYQNRQPFRQTDQW